MYTVIVSHLIIITIESELIEAFDINDMLSAL